MLRVSKTAIKVLKKGFFSNLKLNRFFVIFHVSPALFFLYNDQLVLLISENSKRILWMSKRMRNIMAKVHKNKTHL